LTGFVAATPLLLNRTLTASQKLDKKLEALVHTQRGFLLDQEKDMSGEERRAWLNFPRSLEWKLRAVDDLTMKLLARTGFMDRVLNGMGDGVLVADAEGHIVFANPEAAKIFGRRTTKLLGTSLTTVLLDHSVFSEEELREVSGRIQTEQVFEKEFQTKGEATRHYTLQMSAIVSRADTEIDVGPTEEETAAAPLCQYRVIGILVLTSDISRRVELERTRMETLQLVSHELRTPLTSIRGLSDVLIKFPVEESEAKVMLETINAEAVRLSETINRYLDITRLESGRQHLNLKSVDVEKTLVSCIRLHRPLAAERDIEIKLECREALPTLTADEQLLAQAANNLLSNAIKYSSHNTTIKILATEENEQLRIEVRDEGLGIPERERERVFEKFYRLERDAKSETIGTGLGLSLVREIVEKHKGRIVVESELGKGSAFIISLPLKA
jgi:two-component system phosphate regulon sensor histidine kinase PhoR